MRKTSHGELARMHAGFDDQDGESADALAERWDAAVRLHASGDLEGAAAGYAEVLALQPRFAPAHHLAGVVAAARERKDDAANLFAAAIAAEPRFVDARIAGAELALAGFDLERARALVDDGLAHDPRNVSLLRLRGRIHLRARDGPQAERAFRELLMLVPADADAHFRHGVALQRVGDAPAAARAYQRALTLRPDLIDADFNLGVLFEQQGNRRAAETAYAHVLAVDPRHVAAYKHLGELLLAAGEVDRWLANFHAFETHCPASMSLAVCALEACQHEGDFASVDRYLDGLRRDEFRAEDEEDLADCLESLLYLLLFFDVEPSLMLRLAQAYDALAPRVYGDRIALPARRKPGRVRVGYLSGDLRNHVMGKMMWQAVAHHDRERFELFFYSTSAQRDEWTQRFESAASRFDVIAPLDDAAAAARIAADDLDLLVDLSTHTKGARPGILARKPARVQMTHVASAGTVGLSRVDLKLTDRYCDVPENQEFQLERLIAMDGCVYPYRHVAAAEPHPFHRAAARHRGRRRRDRRVREPAQALASRASPLARSAGAHPQGRHRILAGESGDARELRPHRQGGRHRGRPSPVPAAGPQRRGEPGALRDRRLRSRHDAVRRGQRHDRGAQRERSGRHARRQAARREDDVFDTRQSRRRRRRSRRRDATTSSIAERLAHDAAFRASVKRDIAAGIAKSALTDMAAHTRNLEAAYLAAVQEWTSA